MKEINMTITSTTTQQSALQEAKETAAQTKAEAAKGDPQAVRKLARQQPAVPPQAAQQPTDIVDSSRGKLDTEA